MTRRIQPLEKRQSPWREADLNALRAGLAKGMTAQQLSDSLGGRFSRNAVIGKVKRLGLHLPGGAQGSGRAKKRFKTVQFQTNFPVSDKPLNANQIAFREEREHQMFLLRHARNAPFTPLIGCEPVPLTEIERHQCHWPVPGGFHESNDLLCGRRTDSPPYCSVHTQMRRATITEVREGRSHG